MLVSGAPRVQISSGSQLNDLVEIYTTVNDMGTNAVQVSTASESIIQAGNGRLYAVALPVKLRKVSSYEWATS